MLASAKARSAIVVAAFNEGGLVENIAYPRDFHDAVRDYMVKGLRAGGNRVETEVSLTLPGVTPVTARLDILARNPNGALYGIEVKTGSDPTFTPSQAIVYPHAIGGAGVVSLDEKIRSLGLTPGAILPPFIIRILYAPAPNAPLEIKPIPIEPK